MTRLKVLRYVLGFLLAFFLMILRREFLPDMSLAATAGILIVILIIAYWLLDYFFKEPKPD